MNYPWTSPPPSLTAPTASYGPAPPAQYHALPPQPHFAPTMPQPYLTSHPYPIQKQSFPPVAPSIIPPTFASQPTSSMIPPEVCLVPAWAPTMMTTHTPQPPMTWPCHHPVPATPASCPPIRHHHTTHLHLHLLRGNPKSSPTVTPSDLQPGPSQVFALTLIL